MATLISLAGLPGSDKSSIARMLARRIGAVWLRIDSIEQAIKDSGMIPNEAGYLAAHAIAQDNLALGLDVVGDCVNPWTTTRDAWREAGLGIGADVVEVEVICSDREEHRRRVERRVGDIPGLLSPDWTTVLRCDYRPWDRDRLTVDTAFHDVSTCIEQVLSFLPKA